MHSVTEFSRPSDTGLSRRGAGSKGLAQREGSEGTPTHATGRAMAFGAGSLCTG